MYYKVKIVVDEELYCVLRESEMFVGINFCFGMLMLELVGKVELGRMKGLGGDVSREMVVVVVDELLVREGVRNGWIDLLDGVEGVREVVERVVREGVDVVEGDLVYDE